VNFAAANIISEKCIVQLAVTGLVTGFQFIEFLHQTSRQFNSPRLQPDNGAIFKITVLLCQLQYKPVYNQFGLTVVDEYFGFH
jgi:hypothetical protein